MSYQPGSSEESIFITAWNSVDQAMPLNTSSNGLSLNYNFTFDLDTIGIGDRVTLASNVITPPDSLFAYWCGDVRHVTDNISGTGTNYAIEFDNSTTTHNAPGQVHESATMGDCCHAVYDSAELKIEIMAICSGDSIAPYVRVLGFLLEG